MNIVLLTLGSFWSFDFAVRLFVRIAVVAGAVLAYVLFRRIQARLSRASALGAMPARITLTREPNPRWRTRREVERLSADLGSQGFQDLGSFKVPELKCLLLRAFMHPAERLRATVYDHHAIDPTFDIYCRFDDGTTLTGTSTSMGSALDRCPWNTTLWLPGRTVAEVHAAMLSHPQPGPRVSVSRERFVEEFTSAYRRTMDWRIRKGGVSADEIARHASSQGMKVTSLAIERTHHVFLEAHAAQVRKVCLEEYRGGHRMSEEAWKEIEDRLIVIPEGLTRKEAIEVLESCLDITAEQRSSLEHLEYGEKGTAIDFIEQALQGPLARLRVRMLGIVDGPVRACILLRPEEAAVRF